MHSSLYAIFVPALLPVIFVLVYVYKKDKVEKEPFGFVLKVLIWGAILSIPCAGLEQVAEMILGAFFEAGTVNYAAAENILGVALIEELSKYLVLMIFVWRNKNFDYRYDGIVYAVSASLGFAALENVLYIISFGTEISIGRALFAIPGHATFGVFMGYYLSRAKDAKLNGQLVKSKFCRLMALLSATIIHGIYDFLLDDVVQENYFFVFYIFVIILDVRAIMVIRHEFKTDRPLGPENIIRYEDAESGYDEDE